MKTNKFFIVLILVLVSNIAFAAGKVTLIIEPPRHDGGERLMLYHIEYRDISGGPWNKYDPVLVPMVDKGNGQFEYVNVPYVPKNLQEGKEYVFRVSVENYYGIGRPGLESDIVLVTEEEQYGIRVESGEGRERFGTRGFSVLSGVSSVNRAPTTGGLYRKEED